MTTPTHKVLKVYLQKNYLNNTGSSARHRHLIRLIS